LSLCPRPYPRRRWFLQQETGLFKFRLEELERRGGNSLSKFMKSAKITFDKISDGEKAGLSSSLRFNLAMREFESSSFYKIPFAQATDLIMRREVYVMDGFAYVPSGKLVSIVTARFRSNLSRSLAKAAAAFSNIAEDSRIGPLLKNMNRQYTGRDFGKDDTALAGELTAANIDDFAKRSMPLCMRQTHEGLKKVRSDEERRLERSDRKGIILPSYITNNLLLVASLIVGPQA